MMKKKTVMCTNTTPDHLSSMVIRNIELTHFIYEDVSWNREMKIIEDGWELVYLHAAHVCLANQIISMISIIKNYNIFNYI